MSAMFIIAAATAGLLSFALAWMLSGWFYDIRHHRLEEWWFWTQVHIVALTLAGWRKLRGKPTTLV